MLIVVTGPSTVGKSSGLGRWAERHASADSVVNLDACFDPIDLCTSERECRPVLDGLATRRGLTVVDVGAGTQNQAWFWSWLDARAADVSLLTIWAPPAEVYQRNNEQLRGGRSFDDFEATEYGPHRHHDRGRRVDVSGLGHEERVEVIANTVDAIIAERGT